MAGPSRRQALYFPSEMLEELQHEAKRLDRSISWLIQQAWKISRAEMRNMPSTTDFFPDIEYQSMPQDPGNDPEDG
ncbi:MAG: TIGR04563 family protein [Deltaproteobacteria bacterium]|nr:TIGR04563 family protein [Deltaproteobacteria bacterium]